MREVVDFGPFSESEVGAKNGQETVEYGPQRPIWVVGEVRRRSQEPARVRGNWCDQVRKPPAENGWGFIIGGAGGNRTRVRKSSTVRSTYLVWPIEFDPASADRQAEDERVTLDLMPNQVTRPDTI